MALLTQDQQDHIDQMGHIAARAERFFGPVTSGQSRRHRRKKQEADQWETDGSPASPAPDTYPIMQDEAARRGLTLADLAGRIQTNAQRERRVDRKINEIYEYYADLIKTATPTEDNPQFNIWLADFETEVQALVNLEA